MEDYCDHEFEEWRGRSICINCGLLEPYPED